MKHENNKLHTENQQLKEELVMVQSALQDLKATQNQQQTLWHHQHQHQIKQIEDKHWSLQKEYDDLLATKTHLRKPTTSHVHYNKLTVQLWMQNAKSKVHRKKWKSTPKPLATQPQNPVYK